MRRSFPSALWRLAKPYFVSEEKASAWALLVAITSLTLAIIWVNVRLNAWNGAFFNSLQEKHYDDFRRLLLQFAGWAALYIVLAVYQLYLNQMLQIRWRRWLTEVHLQRWMSDAAHYRLSLADFGTDNPDQRIAEDFQGFVSDTLSLFFGLLSSLVSFVAFVGILWSLSGPLTVHGFTVPGYMVWVAAAYSLAGSVLAHRVGRPLITLNYMQQRYEADFRFSLVRARENAEGIALYRGEAEELSGFRQRFGRVVANWWQIMVAQKRYTWFSSFYGQLAIVFPFIVASPRYFSGAIQLGGLMQIGNAFGEVQRSLSWFVDAYVRLAGWRATIDRLDGFVEAVERARSLGDALHAEEAGAIDLEQVRVDVPVRSPLASQSAPEAAGGPPLPATIATRPLVLAGGQRIAPGRNTLIAGPSGSGKSTLFRLLAGIWPFGTGSFATTPRGDTLFLPQKPYLPVGTLRSALGYPRQERHFSDERMRAVLQKVRLAQFADRLDESANWALSMSPGEQQRLAVARALLLAPKWLFLDEATSALDEQTEREMYELLVRELPSTTLISIAHRAALSAFHAQRLRVRPDPDGAARLVLEPIEPQAAGASRA